MDTVNDIETPAPTAAATSSVGSPHHSSLVLQLTLQWAVAVTIFAIHHWWLVRRMSDGTRFGALYDRKFAPLYAGFSWNIKPGWCLLGILVVAAFLWLGPRILLDRTLSTQRVIALAASLFVGVSISVSMIDGLVPSDVGDIPAFMEPFSQRGQEYYSDIGKVAKSGGLVAFLERFSRPDMAKRLSLHSGTHPAGPIVFLWAATEVFGRSLLVASLAAIVFTSMTVMFAFLLSRELYGEASARHAVVLLLVTPSLIWFSATSMDGPMSVFAVMSVWLYVRALQERRSRMGSAVVLGTSMAFASAMTYASAVVALFFAIDTFLAALEGAALVRRRVLLLSSAALVSLAWYGVLWLATGYDPVSAVKMAIANDTHMMGTGVEGVSRYLTISVANVSAFLFGVGLPIAVLWVRSLVSTVRTPARGPRWRFELALAITLTIAAFSSLFTLEVERVWLFVVPLVVAVAAHHLRGLTEAADDPLAWRVTLAGVALQLVVGEALLGTRW